MEASQVKSLIEQAASLKGGKRYGAAVRAANAAFTLLQKEEAGEAARLWTEAAVEAYRCEAASRFVTTIPANLAQRAEKYARWATDNLAGDASNSRQFAVYAAAISEGRRARYGHQDGPFAKDALAAFLAAKAAF